MFNKKVDFLNGVIWKEILLFFFPVFFGTLFQQLYNTIDAIIVGNFVGKEALAAVGGSTGTVINLLVGFVSGFSSGAMVIISQYYGNSDKDKVREGIDSGMALAIGMGTMLMVLGIILAPWILRRLNVPLDIYDYSLIYMRLYFTGMLPTLIYNTGAGILRAVGDSKRPLNFLIVSCLSNIILDVILVAVFKMGVSGAAIATVVSQLFSCMLTLRTLRKTEDLYHFEILKMKVNKVMVIQILRMGLPIGLQSCLYSIANLFVQSSVNTYGTDVVAAYTAFGKIDALFWNYSGALGTSLMTFAGQNFGAGNISRLKKGIFETSIIDVFGTLLITGICLIFGNQLYHLFTSDTGVIEAGVGLLNFLAPYWITFIAVEVMSNALRGCGDSFYSMIMIALGIGAYRILWILFYPSHTIYDTVVCYPVSWALTSVIMLIYYFNGSWLKRSLKKRNVLMK